MRELWRDSCSKTNHGTAQKTYPNLERNSGIRIGVEICGFFAEHDAAVPNHARLWSLVASAERYAADSQRYLNSVLAKIGQKPSKELKHFCPTCVSAKTRRTISQLANNSSTEKLARTCLRNSFAASRIICIDGSSLTMLANVKLSSCHAI